MAENIRSARKARCGHIRPILPFVALNLRRLRPKTSSPIAHGAGHGRVRDLRRDADEDLSPVDRQGASGCPWKTAAPRRRCSPDGRLRWSRRTSWHFLKGAIMVLTISQSARGTDGNAAVAVHTAASSEIIIFAHRRAHFVEHCRSQARQAMQRAGLRTTLHRGYIKNR